MTTTEQRQAVNRRNKREREKRAAIAGRKPQRDEAYKDWIRSLPCAVCAKIHCAKYGYDFLAAILFCGSIPGRGPLVSEAAHVGARGLRQKSSDRETIPLCRAHHGHGYTESHHTLGKLFWETHSIDKDALIAALNRAYGERAA